MSRSARIWAFLMAAPVLGAVVVVGVAGLAPPGSVNSPLGDRINAGTVPERRATNAVTAINFDYRGFDTLGEEFILFAAVAGVMAILRDRRTESATSRPAGDFGRIHQPKSAAIRWLGPGLIGVVILVGLYVVDHAQLTPGGGFQGGAILGTGSLLAYLASRYRGYRRVVPKRLLELAEAVGGGGYAAVGFATVVAGGVFLQNVAPLGRAGDLLSAGTIPIINLAVGLEVAAGFALLFEEFLEETRAPGPGEGRPR